MAVPWGPPLGKLLARVFADGAHHKLVDLLADSAYEWVKRQPLDDAAHRLRPRADAGRRSSSTRWSADRVYGEMVSFAWAVKTDVNHPMRLALDKFLVEFAEDMQTDPETMARAEQVKHQVLSTPRCST